jgi:excisionase family DNA binding protein
MVTEDRNVDVDEMLQRLASLIADAVVRKLDLTRPVAVAESARLLLTAEQAADRLSISRSHLYELLRSGQLQSVLLGRTRRIPVSDLELYVDELPRVLT